MKDDHYLNLRLLELEEKLLAAELISIKDIDCIENFTDPKKREQRIFEVLDNYMQIHFSDYEAYVYYYGVSK